MEVPELAVKVLERLFQQYSDKLELPSNRGRLVHLLKDVDPILAHKLDKILEYLNDLGYVKYRKMGVYPDLGDLFELRITAQGINYVKTRKKELERQKNEDIPKFLEIKNTQDDFYLDLIREINILYYYKLPKSLWIMVRKLFENLLVDVLRKKYGTKNLDLYY